MPIRKVGKKRKESLKEEKKERPLNTELQESKIVAVLKGHQGVDKRIREYNYAESHKKGTGDKILDTIGYNRSEIILHIEAEERLHADITESLERGELNERARGLLASIVRNRFSEKGSTPEKEKRRKERLGKALKSLEAESELTPRLRELLKHELANSIARNTRFQHKHLEFGMFRPMLLNSIRTKEPE